MSNTSFENKVNLAVSLPAQTEENMSNIKTHLGMQLQSLVSKKLRPVKTEDGAYNKYTVSLYVFNEAELDAYASSIIKIHKAQHGT